MPWEFWSLVCYVFEDWMRVWRMGEVWGARWVVMWGDRRGRHAVSVSIFCGVLGLVSFKLGVINEERILEVDCLQRLYSHTK